MKQIVFASGTGTMALFAARHMSLLLSHRNHNNKCHIDTNIEVITVPCVGTASDLMREMTALDQLTGHFNIFPTVLDELPNNNNNNTLTTTTTTTVTTNTNIDKSNSKQNVNHTSSNNNKSNNNNNNRNKNKKKEEKYKFGKLTKCLYNLWCDIKQHTGIEFDLLYAPRTFQILLQHGHFEPTAGDMFYAGHNLAANNINNANSNDASLSSSTTASNTINSNDSNCHILYYHCGGVEGNESQLLRYKKLINQQ